MKNILKAHKLSSQDPPEWPVLKVVLSRMKDKNGGKLYQGSELHNFRITTVKSCADQALADLLSFDDQMRARLEWSAVDLTRSILLSLDTQSWQQSETEDNRFDEIKSALLSIIDVFRAPLEAKGADLTSILDDVEDIVEYARKYLRISSDSYTKIWQLLWSSPDSLKWPNIILISELLLSLPFYTAKVEHNYIFYFKNHQK